MAFLVDVGSFAQKTSTGAQAITGVGFQPKALLLFTTHRTSDGTVANYERGFGVSISPTIRTSYGKSGVDGTTDVGERVEAGAALTISGGFSPTVDASADLDSFDSDGFTLDWTTADGTARAITYIALGGDDLSVDSDYMTVPVGVGTQAETTDFEPDLVLLFGSHVGARPSDQGGSEDAFGAAIDAANEVATNASHGANSAARRQRTDRIILIDNNGGSLLVGAQFDSKSATDFTLDYLTTSFAFTFAWLALAGINFKVGSFNQATSTGNQSVTGFGFKPDCVLFFGFNNAGTTSPVDDGKNFYGAARSSSKRWVTSVASDDGASSTKDTSLDRAACIQHLTSGTPTIDTEADLVSMDPDGFTVDNTIVDGTAREILYVGLGGEPVDSFPFFLFSGLQ